MKARRIAYRVDVYHNPDGTSDVVVTKWTKGEPATHWKRQQGHLDVVRATLMVDSDSEDT